MTTKKKRRNVNKFNEIHVVVCSALGQIVGEFWWPIDHLPLLKLLNTSRRGFYFKWDKLDDLAIQDITNTVRFNLWPTELENLLSKLLWNDGGPY